MGDEFPAEKVFPMVFRRFAHMAGHALLGLTLVVVFAIVFGWVVMVAWNAVVPAVAGLPALTFEQAVAGLVLVRILVGRFTHPRRGAGRWGRHRHHHHHRRHGFATAGRPFRHDAELYTAWWESEGEAAFCAYAARHMGGNGEIDAHGR